MDYINKETSDKLNDEMTNLVRKRVIEIQNLLVEC